MRYFSGERVLLDNDRRRKEGAYAPVLGTKQIRYFGGERVPFDNDYSKLLVIDK